MIFPMHIHSTHRFEEKQMLYRPEFIRNSEYDKMSFFIIFIKGENENGRFIELLVANHCDS